MIFLSGILSQGQVRMIKNIPIQSGSLTYTGGTLSPTWDYYDTQKMSIGGTLEATKAGTYYATFTPKEGWCWPDKTTAAKSVAWSILGIWHRYGVTGVTATAEITAGRTKAYSSFIVPSFSLYSPATKKIDDLSTGVYVMSIADANTSATSGSTVCKITSKTATKYTKTNPEFSENWTTSANVEQYWGTGYTFDDSTGEFTITGLGWRTADECEKGTIFYSTKQSTAGMSGTTASVIYAIKILATETLSSYTKGYWDEDAIRAVATSYEIAATKYTATGEVTDEVASASKYSNRKISGNYLNILEGA